MNYGTFDKFIFRIPTVPINDYIDMLDNEESMDNFFRSDIFAESIKITSENLYKEYRKYIEGNLPSKKQQKMTVTLNKYLSRMSVRCTPFGSFANIGCSEWGNRTSGRKLVKRVYRLDSKITNQLYHRILHNKESRDKLKYCLNDTLYIAGKYIRYMKHNDNAVGRHWYIQPVLNNPLIVWIKQNYASATEYHTLVSDISEYFQLTIRESEEIVDQMIAEQVLIPEIEPDGICCDCTTPLLSKIFRLDISTPEINHIKLILDEMNATTSSPAQRVKDIDSITADLSNLNISGVADSPVQCDSFCVNFEIDSINSLKDEILRSFDVLSKISRRFIEPKLQRFKEMFQQRYEQQTVRLMEVLDPEIGIGFGIPISPLDNPVLKEVRLGRNKQQGNIASGRIGNFDQSLLSKCLSVDNHIIELTESDLISYPDTEAKLLPPTLSCMFSLVSVDGKTMIDSVRFNNTTASALIGRFAYGDKAIRSLLKDICDFEQSCYNDCIIAEIKHLSSPKTGNILTRPNLRQCAISIASYYDNVEYDIPVNDLLVTVKNNEIILLSEKLKKRIIPIMSSAHNSSFNTMPVYDFLCELYGQNARSYFSFSWGQLNTLLKHRPRVVYKNFILNREEWSIFFKGKDGDCISIDDFTKACSENNLPQRILLLSGDNKLYVDTTNLLSIQSACSEIKYGREYVFEEFLFGTPIEKGINQYVQNEFIIPLKSVDI